MKIRLIDAYCAPIFLIICPSVCPSGYQGHKCTYYICIETSISRVLFTIEVKCNNYSIANIQDLLHRAISLMHLACSSKLNEFTRIKLTWACSNVSLNCCWLRFANNSNCEYLQIADISSNIFCLQSTTSLKLS